MACFELNQKCFSINFRCICSSKDHGDTKQTHLASITLMLAWQLAALYIYMYKIVNVDVHYMTLCIDGQLVSLGNEVSRERKSISSEL